MNTHIRIATVDRNLGIQLYEQEMREHQAQITEMASEKIAAASGSGDFIAEALSLFGPPSPPKVVEDGICNCPQGSCHSDTDGDCSWSGCPQMRDGEPMKTGRSCPLLSVHHPDCDAVKADEKGQS